MSHFFNRRLTVIVFVVGIALFVSGCADNEKETESATQGKRVDAAFIDAMIPHHESAIGMAEMARTRTESEFVKDLADQIIDAQRSEIDTLRRIRASLGTVQPGSLSVPDEMMDMDAPSEELEKADPFDREFIDQMVPHHMGAIAMAKAELANGSNGELKALAQSIIQDQTAEIKEMQIYREANYGSAGPFGKTGESSESGAMSGDHSM